ncbi:hypothetical protein DIPPA_06338 [Diplonema papillatum]|nr:hypothetical protein DIPPA_06338 [Diplonema papillatum]
MAVSFLRTTAWVLTMAHDTAAESMLSACGGSGTSSLSRASLTLGQAASAEPRNVRVD